MWNLVMAVEIREAAVADAQGIARVHVATWQYAYRGQMPDALLDSLSVERRMAWRVQALTEPVSKSHALVAVDGEVILGFCDVGSSREGVAAEHEGELYAIYVAPDVMGKGIGSALIDEGVRHLRAEGFTHATLWVLESNASARQFYEHKGWSADGITKTEMWNDVPLYELRYSIKLT
jgi:ribosomal protein S18 acetylase RimI-like enzyme